MAGSLDYLTWCRSLKEESCQAKTIKEDQRERARVKENWWLLISWVQSLRSLYLLWFLCPGFPESFQWVSVFLEASWSRASLNFDSDLVLSLSDTNRGNHLFQHHLEWNRLFFTENRVYRPPNTVHYHPGQECPSVSECVLGAALLIPEPLQAFTLLVPGQSCHFLDQRPRNTPSERRRPGSRSL